MKYVKILQVNKYHYLRGGAERVFFNTMDLLKRHGNEVVPFCIRHPKNLSDPYDEYFAKAPEIRDMGFLKRMASIRRFFMNKDAARSLDRLLTKEKFDVAHLHNIFNGLSLAILPVLARHGVPAVITLHDMRMMCPAACFDFDKKRCVNCNRSLFINCVLHDCQKSLPISVMGMMEMNHKDHFFNYDKYISRYILLNHKYLDFFASRHPYFSQKGEVLFNFVEMPEDVEPHRGGYMLFVGRMVEEKGVLTLLKAAARLQDIKFKFAGTGPMEQVVRESGLKNVEALGFVSGDALTDLISDCDFCIVPSECMENNPMAVIEGNALGKPTIGAEIGGVPEIICDGTTGYLFKPGDVDELTEKIRTGAALDDEEYCQMSMNAFVFAKENFSSLHHYNELMRIYNEAIAKKKL